MPGIGKRYGRVDLVLRSIDGPPLLCPDEQFIRFVHPKVIAPGCSPVVHKCPGVARVVHPRQDGDGILGVQSGAARDLDVAVSVAVELVSSVRLIVGAARERNPNAGTCFIFVRDVGESSCSVKREDARCFRKIWRLNSIKTLEAKSQNSETDSCRPPLALSYAVGFVLISSKPRAWESQ